MAADIGDGFATDVCHWRALVATVDASRRKSGGIFR
jgi:hypothetical protein